MAGPIKISILADAAQAVKEVTRFSETVDSETRRVVTTLGDSKLQGGFGKIQEGFDVADTRAMGFRDTITGVQDTMTAFQALTTSTADAQARYNEAVAKFGKDSQEAKVAQEALAQTQKTLGDKVLLLGTGVGDLASGFANFIVPLVAVGVSMNQLSLASIRATAAGAAQRVGMLAGAAASGVMTAAQWALNAAMSANPIGIIIIAIIALVAAVVLAYKKSETFRAIVQAVWAAIKSAVSGAINFITQTIPKVWNSAVTWFGKIPGVVSKMVDGVVNFVKGLPGKILALWVNANRLLIDVGRRIINGLLDGLKAGFARVQEYLNSITDKIPDWKGPASKDKKLLTKNGQYIIDGLLVGLESRYGDVRKSLGGFTDSIGASASGSIDINAGSASYASTAATGAPLEVNLNLDGRQFATLIIDPLKREVRARGGVTATLGA